LTIEIDGGYGEGGGQIVRTAIAMSCALRQDVSISNIRKGRRQPGLRPQHLAGISLAAEMTDAVMKGLEVESTDLEFRPKTNTGGKYEIDIGTAGSVSLVIQTCLLPALFSNGSTELIIHGGTDVPWSPPIDYLDRVFLPILRKMGVNAELFVEQRGFYPSGGGIIRLEISPSRELRGLELTARGKMKEISGSIVSRNLPEHVCERMKNAAVKSLADFPAPKISIDSGRGPSTGAVISLAAIYEKTILGSNALGEKGVPAERVGEIASEGLKEEMISEATLDIHATDQIIPFLYLGRGRSEFRTTELSLHARTNIWVMDHFIKRNKEISETGQSTRMIIS